MTDHEAKALEVVKRQYGLFGFHLVLAPKQEAAAVKVVAAALREATLAEREACAEIATQTQFTMKVFGGMHMNGVVEACKNIATAIRGRNSTGE